MIGMAGDTPSFAHPHRLLLRSSGRLSELFCCLVNAECNRVQAIAIAFQRFFLHKSDDFRLVTRFEKRLQLSLKITYVGHRFELLIRYTTALDPSTPRRLAVSVAHRGESSSKHFWSATLQSRRRHASADQKCEWLAYLKFFR